MPGTLIHVAVLVARRGSPTRLPLGVKQPCWGCLEEVRRLAGPGLGGVAVNEVLTKVEGRPMPRHAAPTAFTVEGGGEWARKRRSLRGPSDVCPRPLLLLLMLAVITIGRRA